jgi:hypothetical protein
VRFGPDVGALMVPAAGTYTPVPDAFDVLVDNLQVSIHVSLHHTAIQRFLLGQRGTTNLSHGVLSHEQRTHRSHLESGASSIGYLRTGSVVQDTAAYERCCCCLADCGLPLPVLVSWLVVQATRGGRLVGESCRRAGQPNRER